VSQFNAVLRRRGRSAGRDLRTGRGGLYRPRSASVPAHQGFI